MLKIDNVGKVPAVLLMVLLCNTGWSQDTGDGENVEQGEAVDKEAKQRQAELTRLTEELAIQNAKNALEIAKAPKTETKGLTGSVEVKDDISKAGYFAEIIAYETLNSAADEIAELVGKKGEQSDKPKIVLTTEMATAEHAALWSILEIKMADFVKAFADLSEKHNPKGENQTQGFMDTAPLVLGGLADIASFFKVNQEIYGREVKLNNSALVAEVAARVLELGTEKKKYTVIVPSMSLEGTGELFETLSKLVTARNNAMKIVDDVKREYRDEIAKYARLSKEISKLKKDLAKLKAEKPIDPEKIKQAETQIDAKETEREKYEAKNQRWVVANREIGAAKTAFDKFYDLVTTPPEKGKKSPMEVIAPIDTMKELQKDALFVVLDIVSHGGEVNVTTSTWSGGRVNYIGGSVSVYFIMKGDGQILGAGSSIQYDTGAYKARGGVKTLDTRLVDKKN
jgi:hypothetical protein